MFGLLKYTSGGLIVGQLLSHLFGNVRMLKVFLVHKKTILNTSSSDLILIAKRYVDFPKFSMWGIFLNTASLNATNLFVTWIYSTGLLGQFAHAYRYLTVPITLIGRSIGQVYFQNLSEQKGDGEAMTSIFLKNLKKIFLISLTIFLPIYFFVEPVFPWFFGQEWARAGQYAKILTPLMAVRFIASTLSITLIAIEKQKQELFIHFLILVVTCCLWYYSYVIQLTMEKALILYSWALSFLYCAILGFVYLILKKSNN